MGNKILVVDDEAVNRKLLEAQLTANGYAVATASDGIEAFEKLKNFPADLIILDVMMPHMSGYEFLNELRRKGDPGKKIPVLVMSAKSSMKDFFDAWDILDFLPKPSSIQVLIDKVTSAIGPGETAHPAPATKPAETPVAPKPAVTPTSAPPSISKPATTPTAHPVPTSKLSGAPKTAVLIGVEDFIVGKIRSLLQSKNISVDVALREEDLIESAGRKSFDFVLCQFWEDREVLDAERAQKKLRQNLSFNDSSFFVFCSASFALDAVKIFKRPQIITYQDAKDLEGKFSAALKLS